MRFAKGLLSVFILSFCFLANAFANITIDPDFEGTILISTPEGDLVILEQGDEIPAIAAGSIIEVFEGHCTIHAEEGDSAILALLDQDALLNGPASVILSSTENKGTVKAVKGQITVVGIDGQETVVAEGQEHEVVLSPLMDAEPTEAGEELGFDVGDTETTPDSRSIETSPF